MQLILNLFHKASMFYPYLEYEKFISSGHSTKLEQKLYREDSIDIKVGTETCSYSEQ